MAPRKSKSTKQVLIVEDDAKDFELITQALVDAGWTFKARRVDDQVELDEEMLRLAPDVVLCDHGSAKWNSLAILDQVRAFEPSLPFVIVSGSIDGETQTALLSRGADGCISKDHLDELAPAMRHVMDVHAERQQQKVEEIRRNLVAFVPLRRSRVSRPPQQAWAG